MTIPATTAIGGPYLGDGIQVDFTFPFKVFDDSDLKVYVNNGTTTNVISSSLYSVTIDTVGGTVTLDTALTDGYKLSIVRNVVFEQTTNLEDGQAFFADTLERMDDDLTMQTQELNQRISQQVTFDPTVEDPAELYSQLVAAVDDAEQSATDAETAQVAAETAQTAAEDAGIAATIAANAADASATAAAQSAADAESTFIDSFPYGLTLSNDDDIDHDISISAGRIFDYIGVPTTNIIELASDIVKQIDANWVAGDNAGGFPSTLTLAANTWYHVFVIKNTTTGDVDAGYDTALDCSNLRSDATGYDSYKRIGSVLTDASLNIIPFSQKGNYFQWTTRAADLFQANITTTDRVEQSISTPLGVVVKASLNVLFHTGGTKGVLFTPLTETDQVPVYDELTTVQDDHGVSDFEILTDTASKVGYRATATATNNQFDVYTKGWYEFL